MTIDQRTLNRMRKFRSSSLGRFRPSTESSTREQVLERIQHALYDPHWDYWYSKLRKVILANAGYQGRQRPIDELGIFYLNQGWFIPAPEIGRTEAHEFDIVPLHPEYPELEEQLIKITANLSELDIETYEVKRFLAGMLMFPAPINTFEDSLGRTIFRKVGEFLHQLADESHEWNESLAKSYHTFMQEHDYLIDAMSRRVLMNMLARDAHAKEKR